MMNFKKGLVALAVGIAVTGELASSVLLRLFRTCEGLGLVKGGGSSALARWLRGIACRRETARLHKFRQSEPSAAAT